MSSRSRKYPSGSDKRKTKKVVDKLIQSQRDDIHKFLKSNTGASTASINLDDDLAIFLIEEEEDHQPTSGNLESDQQGENADHILLDDIDITPIKLICIKGS